MGRRTHTHTDTHTHTHALIINIAAHTRALLRNNKTFRCSFFHKLEFILMRGGHVHRTDVVAVVAAVAVDAQDIAKYVYT